LSLKKKLDELTQKVELVQKTKSQTNTDLLVKTEVLEKMREAKDVLQRAQQHEEQRKHQLEATSQENTALKTKLAKTDYRMMHLMRYIEELEGKQTQSESSKLKYRIQHLLKYIDEFEKKVESGRIREESGDQPIKKQAAVVKKPQNTNTNDNKKKYTFVGLTKELWYALRVPSTSGTKSVLTNPFHLHLENISTSSMWTGHGVTTYSVQLVMTIMVVLIT